VAHGSSSLLGSVAGVDYRRDAARGDSRRRVWGGAERMGKGPASDSSAGTVAFAPAGGFKSPVFRSAILRMRCAGLASVIVEVAYRDARERDIHEEVSCDEPAASAQREHRWRRAWGAGGHCSEPRSIVSVQRPLERAAEALRLLDRRKTDGKVVLTSRDS
jgi:hypothetical protein